MDTYLTTTTKAYNLLLKYKQYFPATSRVTSDGEGLEFAQSVNKYNQDKHWRKVVGIVKATFYNGTLSDNIMWHTAVLIPKGDDRDFGGVGLVEVF